MKAFLSFVCTVVATAGPVFAQQVATKPAEGTLVLSKKTFQLSHAIAYEATIADEETTVVVLTLQPVTSEQLKNAHAQEKEGNDSDFKKPYLKLLFKKSGELKYWSAADNNTTLGQRSDEAMTGEIKAMDGRAVGQAKEPVDSSALIPAGFDVKFNVALLKATEELPASAMKKGGPAAKVKPTVSGTFKGNSKEAKLAYVSARWVEPFDGKPGIGLLFTEKDHSKDKKADINAMFSKFGNALIISLHEDGSIYGCQVVHSAMKNKGFSSIGSIEAASFTYENGKVEGEITTNGEVDAFGENWEVKLKFVAPLGEIPKEYQVAEESKPEKSAANPAKESNEEDAAMTMANEKPAVAGPKAKEIALTKDATGVDYKGVVGQIDFQSKLSVKAACAELSANLKSQGWNKDGDDLITPASSILNRKRGSAKLTIFVKPDGGGSQIRMMTEGLEWEEN